MQFIIWVDNIGPHTLFLRSSNTSHQGTKYTKTLRGNILTTKVNKLTMKDFQKETKNTISTYRPSTINNL